MPLLVGQPLLRNTPKVWETQHASISGLASGVRRGFWVIEILFQKDRRCARAMFHRSGCSLSFTQKATTWRRKKKWKKKRKASAAKASKQLCGIVEAHSSTSILGNPRAPVGNKGHTTQLKVWKQSKRVTLKVNERKRTREKEAVYSIRQSEFIDRPQYRH